MHNPFRLLDYNAKIFPDRTALDDGVDTLSYRQLNVFSRRVAAKLGKLGISKGQVVATCMPDKLDWIFTLALFHEACITCSNQMFREIDPALGVDWLITGVRCDWFPEDRQIIIDQAWLDEASKEAPAEDCKDYGDADALCRLVFTSGTTGYPKATMFNVEQLLSYMIRVRNCDGIDPNNALCVLPMCTMFGFYIAMSAMISAETCYIADTFDECMKMIESGKVEFLAASPFQLTKLAELIAARKKFKHSIKTVLTGGTAVAPDLFDKVSDTFKADFFIAYGSTEAGRITINALRDKEHLKFAGLVVHDAIVEILDDDGNVLPPGRPGIIRTKTPNMISGYYKDPDTTAELFKDGWFYPGDRGLLTKNGALVLAGRTNEVINRGGVKIDPARLDQFLQSQAGIEDAAVVGMQNEEGLQEIVAALVIPEEFDFKALQKAIVQAFGTSSAPNRYARFNRIPRNQMGKIDRNKIRDTITTMNSED